MRAWLFICFLLLVPVAAPGHAQQPGQASPPPSTTGEAGLVEGDVYLRMQNGDVRRMASGQVYLVPDSVWTALAPLCAVRESRRTQYVRLRRPIRLAYDSARSARGGTRSALLDRADSAAAAAAAALVPARQAEADIVARLSAQRAARISAEARYVFDAVAPGDYVLYSDANLPNSLFGLPYFWFVPIRVMPGRQTRDLDNTNMASVLFDRPSAVAWAACLTPRPPPAVPDSVGAKEAVKERPVLINREEVQRELRRRYPSVLRGSGGSVIVRMRILEDGSVDVETVEALNLRVREEALNNSTLEKVRRETESAAEMVAERMRFSPATLDGRAVKVWVNQPVTFQ